MRPAIFVIRSPSKFVVTLTRLRELLTTATASPDAASLVPDTAKEEKLARQRAEQRQAKIELWGLFSEWSEIARADITRRDHLIQLGIAKRKKKQAKGGEGDGEK